MNMVHTTNDNGSFHFASIPLGANVTITPTKDDNPLNGVSTYDLVLITKHILGLEPLTLSDLNTNMMANHFEGVKIGDVNGTAIANSLQSVEDRTAATLLFDVQDRTVKAGEVFTVNFKGAERVQGYQFTMNFNGLEVVDIVPGTDMKLDNFGVFADAITTSVDGAANEFAVTFRATKAGQISQMLGVSSRITKAEAYNLTNDRLDVAFRFSSPAGMTISGVGFELYQNQPNPFVNKTFIGFHLPEATQATLRILDEAGRMVFTQNGDFAKGYNTFAIDRQLITTTGVLYYTVETTTDSATKKMIQSK
ncbi:MAG: T9SS type A sorting domain-containing protein [Lewinellaceae bacterium]|nr:T9SS type A sorting domain-containing protein [Lewinellaceae bacterium]